MSDIALSSSTPTLLQAPSAVYQTEFGGASRATTKGPGAGLSAPKPLATLLQERDNQPKSLYDHLKAKQT